MSSSALELFLWYNYSNKDSTQDPGNAIESAESLETQKSKEKISFSAQFCLLVSVTKLVVTAIFKFNDVDNSEEELETGSAIFNQSWVYGCMAGWISKQL